MGDIDIPPMHLLLQQVHGLELYQYRPNEQSLKIYTSFCLLIELLLYSQIEVLPISAHCFLILENFKIKINYIINKWNYKNEIYIGVGSVYLTSRSPSILTFLA